MTHPSIFHHSPFSGPRVTKQPALPRLPRDVLDVVCDFLSVKDVASVHRVWRHELRERPFLPRLRTDTLKTLLRIVSLENWCDEVSTVFHVGLHYDLHLKITPSSEQQWIRALRAHKASNGVSQEISASGDHQIMYMSLGEIALWCISQYNAPYPCEYCQTDKFFSLTYAHMSGMVRLIPPITSGLFIAYGETTLSATMRRLHAMIEVVSRARESNHERPEVTRYRQELFHPPRQRFCVPPPAIAPPRLRPSWRRP